MMLLIFKIFVMLSTVGFSNSQVMIETGAYGQTLNQAQIPGETATRFDLEEPGQGVSPHFRLETRLQLSDRHHLRGVYAPLQRSYQQSFSQSVDFNNAVFAANTSTSVGYKFNSYRLTYMYDLVRGSRSNFQLGLTLKVRDAEISLRQTGAESSYSDLGFVPLVYLAYSYQISTNWNFFTDLDGAAAPQGRAFDFTMKIRRVLSDAAQLGLGYRTLEGGADNNKVYTFSWFHYATIDLVASF